LYVTGKMSDSEYQKAVRELQPDIIIVAGWYYMLPRSLRELAPRGAAGLHASLLPKYRGGAPLVWATIKGETKTGVSFFYFADGVDEGDIIGQAGFDIAFQDDIADLVYKAAQASVDLIRQYVPLLATGNAPRVPQDHSQATLVPQRQPEDGIIDWWNLSARQVYDWVRAQTRPYPGAFTFLSEEKVTIWKAGLDENSSLSGLIPAGTLLLTDRAECGVCCADGRLLLIREVGLEDGSTLTDAEFRGLRNVEAGARFEMERSHCASLTHD
jgi:methionyl-tRNA formyltransferase